MSLESCLSALETTLASVGGLDASHVSQNNYKILGLGGSCFAVVRPGYFIQNPWDMGGGYKLQWMSSIELFSKFDAQLPGSAQAHLSTLAYRVMGTVLAKPDLGTADVWFAEITSGAAPEEVFTPDGRGPMFLMQSLACKIVEGTAIV